ncbi:zinc transporter ZIP1 isoform X2 [Pristis pectinata]|uniref:zinc transporter ZIP1 isoform X2 n=1 Tax=Pristis pectinata TaxID=685728 RepID=UPI00223DACF8|nr:zinc transporter ZIP1 isoform X2 [Pristis pectinata]
MAEAGPGKVPLEPGVDLRMSPGTEVKVVSLALLLGLTVLSGLLPVCALRGAAAVAGGSAGAGQRRVLSLLSCLAGGVFLATCLLDLLPDYLEDMAAVLDKMKIVLEFPLPEFIVAMGFFLVLIMEQITLACRDQAGNTEETRALLGRPSPHHEGLSPREEAAPHLHVDFNSHSAIRCLVLVLALSLHSVFEGLALGVQQTSAKVVEICVALSVHKCIVAFSLTLKLVQSRLRWTAVVACVVTFAVMSPLGIGLGIMLTEDSSHQLVRAVLEGMATGTFIYITFMEILPHELNSSHQRILKVIMLILGFSLVTGVLFIKV